MASAVKHMQKSHRGYHKNVDFTNFHRKAHLASAKKVQRQTLGEILKSALRKTQDK